MMEEDDPFKSLPPQQFLEWLERQPPESRMEIRQILLGRGLTHKSRPSGSRGRSPWILTRATRIEDETTHRCSSVRQFADKPRSTRRAHRHDGNAFGGRSSREAPCADGARLGRARVWRIASDRLADAVSAVLARTLAHGHRGPPRRFASAVGMPRVPRQAPDSLLAAATTAAGQHPGVASPGSW